jgi:hypothetical protein
LHQETLSPDKVACSPRIAENHAAFVAMGFALDLEFQKIGQSSENSSHAACGAHPNRKDMADTQKRGCK